jgi:5'-3' exonuclease
MFMIFSPKSNSLIPFNLGTLMTDNKLIDLYPTKCIITHDGYNTDWQKDIILPALDPQRIADVIIPEAIPNLNQKFPYENELFIDVRENLKRKKQVYVKPRETTPRLGTASTLSSSTSSGLKRPLVARRP